MKWKSFLPVGIILLIQSCSGPDVSLYVDPNIGSVAPLLTTKNPTVHRPHSMVRVFPVTKPGLNDRYLSDRIYGFAINMPAYRQGHVGELMPFSGEPLVDRNATASWYDHDMEEVHPWYHRVLLEDQEIVAEWTTTERSVLYRFTFSGPDSNHIIFRSNGKSQIVAEGDRVILGWEEYQGVKQFFHAEFSIPFDRSGELEPKGGRGSVVFAGFDKLEQPLEVRIGISFIDEEQAARNLHGEAGNRDFETVREESHRIWEEALGKIRVKGGTERQKRIFYTSLYRAMERMVNISEEGRYFSAYDGRVHEDGGRPFYVDDWLWDTYRSLHPLMLILDPSRQEDMVESYVRMYDQSGWMPGFPQIYGDFPAMIGFHSAAMVWDSWQKGAREFDVEKAYEGLRKNAMEATMLPWRNGPGCALDSFYREIGWFPAIPEDVAETESMVHGFEKRQAVAVTLEHSYDDWCLAQLAGELGKEADYKYFMERSRNFRHLFNPANGFFAPRMADGNWVEPFDPVLSGGTGGRSFYAENNAWTWNFSVQHDVEGLIGLLGGNQAFTDRLDQLFNEPTRISKWQYMGQFPDATGLNGMFVAGNEPSMHIPYLYNYAGQPWKTQRRIREIMDRWFDDRPPGIPGDEDGGALCAWYVFSAMGFYPVTPGSGEYAIGSPFFSEIDISLPDGKTFKVVAENCSQQNKYIQSATLKGEELTRPFLSHGEIMQGGTLYLVMGDRPNKEWGTTGR